MIYCEELTYEEFDSCDLLRRKIYKHLYSEFKVDDFETKFKFNWHKLNGKLMLIDYGHWYFD